MQVGWGEAAFKEFDRAVRGAVEDILGSGFTEPQWTQVTLPTSMGGLGFWRSADHSPAAYISSISDSIDIMKTVIGMVFPQVVEDH